MTSSKQWITWFVLTVFCFQSGIPSAGAQNPLQSFSPARPETPSSDFPVINISSEYGTVESVFAGSGPVIFHIQEAHGSEEVQKNIQAILHELKNYYGVNLVLIEGSAFPLERDLLRFSSGESGLTRTLAEGLARKSLLSGPELFLLEEPSASAYGIEDAGAYLDNGRAFREVLLQKEKTAGFSAQMNIQIQRLTSPYLSQDLRAFLSRLEDFEKGLIPLDEWLREIQKEARERLDLDLENPYFQLEWPMLLRLFMLKNLKQVFDESAFNQEREAFLSESRKYLPAELFRKVEEHLAPQLLPHHLADPATSLLFENTAQNLPRDFDYGAYPNVNRFIGQLILHSELKPALMGEELEKISAQIAEKMAHDSRALEVVELLKGHRLLKHLFSLELTPRQYLQVKEQKESLRPSVMAEKFLALNEEKRVKDSDFEQLAEMDKLYDLAAEFYEGTHARDRFMFENIERRLKETGETKAVVITGGFHSGPFQDYFQNRDYAYALISPKISQVSGREPYVRSILTFYTHPKPDAASTYKEAPYFLTRPSDLPQLGVNPEPLGEVFRETLAAVAGTGNIEPETVEWFRQLQDSRSPAEPARGEVFPESERADSQRPELRSLESSLSQIRMFSEHRGSNVYSNNERRLFQAVGRYLQDRYELEPGFRVLEPGLGYARNAAEGFFQSGASRVTGVNNDEGQPPVPHPEIELIRGDAAKLPWSEPQFETVVFNATLSYIAMSAYPPHTQSVKDGYSQMKAAYQESPEAGREKIGRVIDEALRVLTDEGVLVFRLGDYRTFPSYAAYEIQSEESQLLLQLLQERGIDSEDIELIFRPEELHDYEGNLTEVETPAVMFVRKAAVRSELRADERENLFLARMLQSFEVLRRLKTGNQPREYFQALKAAVESGLIDRGLLEKSKAERLERLNQARGSDLYDVLLFEAFEDGLVTPEQMKREFQSLLEAKQSEVNQWNGAVWLLTQETENPFLEIAERETAFDALRLETHIWTNVKNLREAEQKGLLSPDYVKRKTREIWGAMQKGGFMTYYAPLGVLGLRQKVLSEEEAKENLIKALDESYKLGYWLNYVRNLELAFEWDLMEREIVKLLYFEAVGFLYEAAGDIRQQRIERMDTIKIILESKALNGEEKIAILDRLTPSAWRDFAYQAPMAVARLPSEYAAAAAQLIRGKVLSDPAKINAVMDILQDEGADVALNEVLSAAIETGALASKDISRRFESMTASWVMPGHSDLLVQAYQRGHLDRRAARRHIRTMLNPENWIAYGEDAHEAQDAAYGRMLRSALDQDWLTEKELDKGLDILRRYEHWSEMSSVLTFVLSRMKNDARIQEFLDRELGEAKTSQIPVSYAVNQAGLRRALKLSPETAASLSSAAVSQLGRIREANEAAEPHQKIDFEALEQMDSGGLAALQIISEPLSRQVIDNRLDRGYLPLLIEEIRAAAQLTPTFVSVLRTFYETSGPAHLSYPDFLHQLTGFALAFQSLNISSRQFVKLLDQGGSRAEIAGRLGQAVVMKMAEQLKLSVSPGKIRSERVLEDWRLDYLGLLISTQSYWPEENREYFKAILRFSLEGRFRALFDPEFYEAIDLNDLDESTEETVRAIREHNENLLEEAAALGIDPKALLNPQSFAAPRVLEGEISQVRPVTVLRQLFRSYQMFVNNQADRADAGETAWNETLLAPAWIRFFSGTEEEITRKPGMIRNLEGLRDLQNYLEDQTRRLAGNVPEETADLLRTLNEASRLAAGETLVKESGRSEISFWQRLPGQDAFLGNCAGSCTALGSNASAIFEFLLDLGTQYVILRDAASREVRGYARFFLYRTEDGEAGLFVDSIDGNIPQTQSEAMLDFIREYGARIGIPESRVSDRTEKAVDEKIGHALTEHYFHHSDADIPSSRSELRADTDETPEQSRRTVKSDEVKARRQMLLEILNAVPEGETLSVRALWRAARSRPGYERLNLGAVRTDVSESSARRFDYALYNHPKLQVQRYDPEEKSETAQNRRRMLKQLLDAVPENQSLTIRDLWELAREQEGYEDLTLTQVSGSFSPESEKNSEIKLRYHPRIEMKRIVSYSAEKESRRQHLWNILASQTKRISIRKLWQLAGKSRELQGKSPYTLQVIKRDIEEDRGTVNRPALKTSARLQLPRSELREGDALPAWLEEEISEEEERLRNVLASPDWVEMAESVRSDFVVSQFLDFLFYLSAPEGSQNPVFFQEAFDYLDLNEKSVRDFFVKEIYPNGENLNLKDAFTRLWQLSRKYRRAADDLNKRIREHPEFSAQVPVRVVTFNVNSEQTDIPMQVFQIDYEGRILELNLAALWNEDEDRYGVEMAAKSLGDFILGLSNDEVQSVSIDDPAAKITLRDDVSPDLDLLASLWIAARFLTPEETGKLIDQMVLADTFKRPDKELSLHWAPVFLALAREENITLLYDDVLKRELLNFYPDDSEREKLLADYQTLYRNTEWILSPFEGGLPGGRAELRSQKTIEGPEGPIVFELMEGSALFLDAFDTPPVTEEEKSKLIARTAQRLADSNWSFIQQQESPKLDALQTFYTMYGDSIPGFSESFGWFLENFSNLGMNSLQSAQLAYLLEETVDSYFRDMLEDAAGVSTALTKDGPKVYVEHTDENSFGRSFFEFSPREVYEYWIVRILQSLEKLTRESSDDEFDSMDELSMIRAMHEDVLLSMVRKLTLAILNVYDTEGIEGQSASEYLEQRFFDLAKNQPKLTPWIAKIQPILYDPLEYSDRFDFPIMFEILTDEFWDQLPEALTADELQVEQLLPFALGKKDIAGESEEQNLVNNAVFGMTAALKKNAVRDEGWRNPLDELRSALNGKKVVLYDLPGASEAHEGEGRQIPSALRFFLAFLNEAAEAGFRNLIWEWDDYDNNATHLRAWWGSDTPLLEAYIKTLENFLREPGDISFAEYMTLPRKKEKTDEVVQTIAFWEALRSVVRQLSLDIRFAQSLKDGQPETGPLNSWTGSALGRGEGLIIVNLAILGRKDFTDSEFMSGLLSSDSEVLHIQSRLSFPEPPEKLGGGATAFGYSAYQVSLDEAFGTGDYRTSAIRFAGNDALHADFDSVMTEYYETKTAKLPPFMWFHRHLEKTDFRLMTMPPDDEGPEEVEETLPVQPDEVPQDSSPVGAGRAELRADESFEGFPESQDALLEILLDPELNFNASIGSYFSPPLMREPGFLTFLDFLRALYEDYSAGEIERARFPNAAIEELIIAAARALREGALNDLEEEVRDDIRYALESFELQVQTVRDVRAEALQDFVFSGEGSFRLILRDHIKSFFDSPARQVGDLSDSRDYDRLVEYLVDNAVVIETPGDIAGEAVVYLRNILREHYGIEALSDIEEGRASLYNVIEKYSRAELRARAVLTETVLKQFIARHSLAELDLGGNNVTGWAVSADHSRDHDALHALESELRERFPSYRYEIFYEPRNDHHFKRLDIFPPSKNRRRSELRADTADLSSRETIVRISEMTGHIVPFSARARLGEEAYFEIVHRVTLRYKPESAAPVAISKPLQDFIRREMPAFQELLQGTADSPGRVFGGVSGEVLETGSFSSGELDFMSLVPLFLLLAQRPELEYSLVLQEEQAAEFRARFREFSDENELLLGFNPADALSNFHIETAENPAAFRSLVMPYLTQNAVPTAVLSGQATLDRFSVMRNLGRVLLKRGALHGEILLLAAASLDEITRNNLMIYDEESLRSLSAAHAERLLAEIQALMKFLQSA